MIITKGVVDVVPGLREGMGDNQRRLMHAIWQEFRQTGDWPLRRSIERLGSKIGREAVISHLTGLGGCAVFVGTAREGGQPTYELTLLGALLTSQGGEIEDALAKLLQSVRDRVARDPKVRRISARELGDAQDLSYDEIELVGKVLRLHSRGLQWGGSFSVNWVADIPDDIDEVLEASDLPAEVRKIASIDYDPKCPIEPHLRMQFFGRSAQSREQVAKFGEFMFVKDEGLRALLASDWREAQRTFEVQAWKACMVLCGAVAEGLLLDALDSELDEIPDPVQKRKDARETRLYDLIDDAGKKGILSGPLASLGHAVRGFRNFIHPKVQLRHKLSASEDSARVALGSVRMLIERLQDLAQDKDAPP